MALQAHHCPHRLRFKRPFVTAHGVRDGTDAIFLRLTQGAVAGYGEVSFPPYLQTERANVLNELKCIDLQRFDDTDLKHAKQWLDSLRCSPACRDLVSMALFDMLSRAAGMSLGAWLGMKGTGRPKPANMLTVATDRPSSMPALVREVPPGNVLKIKLGNALDADLLEAALGAWNGPVFLDANQGWRTVAQALEVVRLVPVERLVGLEQPFGKDAHDLHRDLQQAVDVPVYADESVQDLRDLERAKAHFGGLNVKAMKCGGVDQAMELAAAAKDMGLKVMLGCMSESALACAAMLHLEPVADLVDLDGPWLLDGAPFGGMELGAAGWVVEGDMGIGAAQAALLEWIPIGA